MARPGDTPEAVIAGCRGCREACDRQLSDLARRPEDHARFHDTLTCVAVLSLIADRLESGEPCPSSLLEYAVELADRIGEGGDDDCARACRRVADSLADLLDGEPVSRSGWRP